MGDGPLVRIVQPNTPQAEKWRPENRTRQLNKLVDMSRRDGFDKLSAVIWPETAPPFIVELIPLDHQAFRREYDDLRYGRVPAHVSPVCATATQFDPTRAPAGKHTLYMYHFMPYELADGGAKRWDDIKESTADWMLEGYRKYTTNMGPENIIARYVDSPLDYERHSATMRHGDISGIGRYLHQFMGRRPTPELSQYAVPGIEGLYLSGPFMHPGGGVNGGGRATAVKMFKDLKLDMDKAISRAR